MQRSLILKKSVFQEELRNSAIRLAVVNAEFDYVKSRLLNRLWHLACPALCIGGMFYIPDPFIITTPLQAIGCITASAVIENKYDEFKTLVMEKAELEAKMKQTQASD